MHCRMPLQISRQESAVNKSYAQLNLLTTCQIMYRQKMAGIP